MFRSFAHRLMSGFNTLRAMQEEALAHATKKRPVIQGPRMSGTIEILRVEPRAADCTVLVCSSPDVLGGRSLDVVLGEGRWAFAPGEKIRFEGQIAFHHYTPDGSAKPFLRTRSITKIANTNAAAAGRREAA